MSHSKLIGERKERLLEYFKAMSLDDEVVNKLYMQLLDAYESGFNFDDNIILRLPENTKAFDSFIINKIIEFSTKSEPLPTWEISAAYKSDINVLVAKGAEHYASVKGRRRRAKLEVEELGKAIRSTKESTNSRIDELQKEIEKIKQENQQIKSALYHELTTKNETIKKQTIPVEIYLDTNEPQEIFKAYESVNQFIEAIGFEKFIELKAEKGSWWKRVIARSKDAITSDEVTDRLRKVEYGVEVNTILKQQSEIDKNQSEALLNILKSVENIPNAAIRIGSLLVVKITNPLGEVNVQVRTLDILEIQILNKCPELLHSPQQILVALTSKIEETKSDILKINRDGQSI